LLTFTTNDPTLGGLVSFEDAGGISRTFVYDNSGRFTNDTWGFIGSVYTYDASDLNAVGTETDLQGRALGFIYEGSNVLTGVIDRAGS
jgi:YD repeat-containing protein